MSDYTEYWKERDHLPDVYPDLVAKQKLEDKKALKALERAYEVACRQAEDAKYTPLAIILRTPKSERFDWLVKSGDKLTPYERQVIRKSLGL
jgi:hypothetical protein